MRKRFAVIANQAFALRNFRGRLLADLRAAGLDVFALAPDFSPQDREALGAAGIEPVDFSLARTGINPVRDLRDTVRLTATLRALELGGVLSVMIKPVIYGTLAAAMAGVPRRYALITGLGYAFGQDDSIRRRFVGAVVRALYRTALARADGVFMQNPDDAREFVDRGLLREDRLLGIYPTGVDLDEWKPAPAVSAPPTFVLAARLLKEKGIAEFVAAARIVRGRSPEARFLVLGGLDGGSQAIPEGDMRRWVHEGLIEWPGHVDVRPWLAQASVFVLPTRYREGVPRSIQEAMAMARPVITTTVPGARETVVEGVNGFLVPPGEVDALAAAMLEFAARPELVAAMGRQSRRLAEERFDVAAINRRLIAAMGLGEAAAAEEQA